MHHFIATDEAGYGPNLGPLVIGATGWTSRSETCNFRNALQNIVFESKSELKAFERHTGQQCLMIADSKAVYSSGKLELLERGVLACVAALHERVPRTIGELLQMLDVETALLDGCGYFDCRENSIPVVADSRVIGEAAKRVNQALNDSEIGLSNLAATVLFPQKFNAGTDLFGNKANLLTAESLGLVKKVVSMSSKKDGDTIDIRCDKHGGRNRYLSAIQDYFSDSFVVVEQESRECSRYLLQDGSSSIEFRAKGEAWLPIALSSMVAKYVRELCMEHWNCFWRKHLPHIKGTKGYPVDARRFKSEIEPVQKRLGIPNIEIWRNK